ncbi:MAG: universal stress protein [Persephonella sp.]|nr:MAG: universal stress protein [Persephonella sp.]
MINRILVGTDGSKYSLIAEEYGIYLSKKLKRPVIAIYIIDKKLISEAIIGDIAGALGFGEYADLTDKIKEYLDEKGKAILKAFAVKCREAKADCSIAQAIGFVANEIINMADPEDLIIIGKKGIHENILPFPLGSSAEIIARNSKTPVMLTPDKFREIKNILVAFDGKEKSIKALRFAEKLAKDLGLNKLNILSVLKKKNTEKQLQLESIVKGNISNVEFEHIFKFGYPEEEIENCINENSIDLVVIGAFGEGRLKEFLLGSTTLYLIEKSNTPVIVVK